MKKWTDVKLQASRQLKLGMIKLNAACFSLLIVITAAAAIGGQQISDTGQNSDKDKEFKLIPREVLFGNPQKASARISPNGKWLSFLAPVEGILNVWVCPVGDLTAAKPVTHDKLRNIRGHSWAYTGQHILYTQDK